MRPAHPQINAGFFASKELQSKQLQESDLIRFFEALV